MAKRTGKPLPPRAPSGPQASAGLAVSPRRAQEVAALFQLGLQLQQRGHLQEAQALYERVLRLHPSHFDALHLLGVIAALSNAPERALQLLDGAISVNPACAPVYSNRGNVLQALGRLEEALASFDRAVSLEPKYTDAHFNRGNTLKQLGRLEEAVASYDQAIAIHAGHAPAWSNRGDALQQLMRLEDAVASYTQAISARPDYAEAHNNLGVALRELNRPAEALARCEAAIACRPDFAQAHSNRGIALQELHRLDEAVASYDRAISLQPDFAGAYHNKALALLLAGRYEEGWPLYEWRWKNPDSGLSPRFPDHPLWLGDGDLTGKTILLHSEQGLGDTLQFCRYAPLVAQRGARVLLEVQPALAGLLRGLAGVSEVLQAGDALPPFDLHCPLMSLPLAFGTTLHTIPAAEGYLNCSPDKLQAWRERLGPRTQPRVGLVWSGNPAYKADSRRSLPL